MTNEENDNQNADKVDKLKNSRFTLVLPLDLYIKMDIEREKTKFSKSEWISLAISEKLEKEKKQRLNSDILEEIKEEICDLKEVILKLK